MRSILAIERTALNFLQRLSGIATLTAQFVAAALGTSATIFDTRKTTPGWRVLEKYAVRCGGGRNHRLGLHDAVLIKDNHLAGLLSQRRQRPDHRGHRRRSGACTSGSIVEVEVDSLEQLDRALVSVPTSSWSTTWDRSSGRGSAAAGRRRRRRARGVRRGEPRHRGGPGSNGRRSDQRRGAHAFGPRARHRPGPRQASDDLPWLSRPVRPESMRTEKQPWTRHRPIHPTEYAFCWIGFGRRRASSFRSPTWARERRVWDDLDALAAFGFALERHPFLGAAYRGPAAAALSRPDRARAGDARIGRRIAVWNRVGSTNDLAARAASTTANDGLAILAEEQTSGRGRRGRVWTAPARSSILMSVLLFPPLALAARPRAAAGRLADRAGGRGDGRGGRELDRAPAPGSSGPTTSGSAAARSPASSSNAHFTSPASPGAADVAGPRPLRPS